MIIKTCTQCGISKPLREFYKRLEYENGIESRCKECRKQYTKEWRKKNSIRHKQACRKRRLDNLTKYKQVDKQRYQDEKEKRKEYARKYRLKNKEECRQRNKKWQEENKKHCNLYSRNRRHNNIQYRLADNLRTRLYRALKNNYKSGSAVRDLGCSINQLKQHLESKFKKGMSWKNYGEWHIDHIKSLSRFDLTNLEEFKKACHYTNLQPLWAEENMKKGSK